MSKNPATFTEQETKIIYALITNTAARTQQGTKKPTVDPKNRLDLINDLWWTGDDLSKFTKIDRTNIPTITHRLEEKGILETAKKEFSTSRKKKRWLIFYRIKHTPSVFAQLWVFFLTVQDEYAFMSSNYYDKNLFVAWDLCTKFAHTVDDTFEKREQESITRRFIVHRSKNLQSQDIIEKNHNNVYVATTPESSEADFPPEELYVYALPQLFLSFLQGDRSYEQAIHATTNLFPSKTEAQQFIITQGTYRRYLQIAMKQTGAKRHELEMNDYAEFFKLQYEHYDDVIRSRAPLINKDKNKKEVAGRQRKTQKAN